MRIEIPELSVVVLVGVSGSGKSTFAKAQFQPDEVLSLDYFRSLVSDDENSRAAGAAALDALYDVARRRLDLGLLTVIDAANVQKEARGPALQLAREQNCPAVAIVLDMPVESCKVRSRQRCGRDFDAPGIDRQSRQLRLSLQHLQKEGFRHVHVLRGEQEAAQAEIVRVPPRNDQKHLTGPFDIIGDIHGCYDELCTLLMKLGYRVDAAACTATPPQGRKVVFVGDLCDRGPKNVQVLRLVMGMVRAGMAWCVAGNHDAKLARCLKGAKVKLLHGLDRTVEQLAEQPPEFVEEVKTFTDGLVSHYVLDQGKLVVAHAGLKEKYQGRSSARVRDFCLYGDTTGQVDEYGLPVRLPWAKEYQGKALVVYGHTPVGEVQRFPNAVCIDTGCVFGGKLTAYRYPEGETVQVEALRMYCQPARPLGAVVPEATEAETPSGSG